MNVLFYMFVGCKKDIVFILDNSNFLTPEQYGSNLMFVSSMVERLYDVGGQFALMSFNNNPLLHINFGQQADTKTEIQNVVRMIANELISLKSAVVDFSYSVAIPC